jgi:hypothetical protein
MYLRGFLHSPHFFLSSTSVKKKLFLLSSKLPPFFNDFFLFFDQFFFAHFFLKRTHQNTANAPLTARVSVGCDWPIPAVRTKQVGRKIGKIRNTIHLKRYREFIEQ